MTDIRRRFGNLRRKGTVASEFALSLPLWMGLLVGVTDTATLLLISQRVDRISYSVADIISQSEMLLETDVQHTFLAASELMKPFPFSSEGIVILTSVQKPSGAALKICWQRKGGGGLARDSRIGREGEVPHLPYGLTLNENENVIFAEVFYAFTPLFINAGFLKAHDLYHVSVYKPRLSSLCEVPKT